MWAATPGASSRSCGAPGSGRGPSPGTAPPPTCWRALTSSSTRSSGRDHAGCPKAASRAPSRRSTPAAGPSSRSTSRRGSPRTSERTLALKAREAILELAESRDAVAIGPGIGLDHETTQVARALARELRQPMAIDADGLTALAGHLDVLRDAPSARCLTPHPGEMARMLGARADEVQRDRIEV